MNSRNHVLALLLVDGDVSVGMSRLPIETWDAANCNRLMMWFLFVSPFWPKYYIKLHYTFLLSSFFSHFINSKDIYFHVYYIMRHNQLFYLIFITQPSQFIRERTRAALPLIFLFFFLFVDIFSISPTVSCLMHIHTSYWAITRMASLATISSPLLCPPACHSYTIQENKLIYWIVGSD